VLVEASVEVEVEVEVEVDVVVVEGEERYWIIVLLTAYL